MTLTKVALSTTFHILTHSTEHYLKNYPDEVPNPYLGGVGGVAGGIVGEQNHELQLGCGGVSEEREEWQEVS